MRGANVLPFPSASPQGGFVLKAYAILFYLTLGVALGWYLPVSERLPLGAFGRMSAVSYWEPASSGLFVLFLLMMLYHFFIRQRGHQSVYFRKNRVLITVLAVVVLVLSLPLTVVVLPLSLLYWALVARRGREAPYFLRFHMLTALILNCFLLLPALILQSLLGLTIALVVLAGLQQAAVPVLAWYHVILPWAVLGLFLVPAVLLSISVLMGRTPYIRMVTAGVRQLA